MSSSSTIKVRFAPSPTGHLHIGGVRTALFNYLYARNQNGQFFLRMEDTDQERSKKEYEQEILKSLTWVGLEWDGEVVFQSSRLDRYHECARELTKQDTAYRVDDQTQAVKLKMPKEIIPFYDVVKGKIEFDTALFDDLVLIKSDGFPSYHFACVVDDHDMGISHVIRGEDHISNSPRQIAIYRALGWTPPKYAHLPLIVGADGTPLSKRHGAVSLKFYEENGFLPEGLLNYLALLGWGPGGDQEFFSQKDLIQKFSLKRVNVSQAAFDLNKLKHINAQHLKKMEQEDYVKRGLDFLNQNHALFPDARSAATFSSGYLKNILLLFRGRIKIWKDIFDQANYCFQDELQYDKNAVQKYFTAPKISSYLEEVLKDLSQVQDFNSSYLESLVRNKAKALFLTAGDLIHPIRVAITGVGVSPGLFELMEVLGKEKVLKRLRHATHLDRFSSGQSEGKV